MALDELPEGFTLDEPTGELPAGFTIDEPQEIQALAPVEPQAPATLGEKAGNVWEGIKQGTTFGFGDELQAAIAAGVARPFVDQSYGELYGQARDELRGELGQAREQSPYLTGGGELAGALLTGGAAAGRILPQGAKAYAATRPIRAAATVGAVEGGLYGFGTGEGGAVERGKQAGEYGLYGAGGGVVGASLLGRAKALLSRKRAAKGLKTTGQESLQEVAERAEEVLPVEGGDKAFGKVAKALKQDLGPDYDDVLNAYKAGDASLIELNQSRTRTLAQGAAQYSGGKASAQEFFDPKIEDSYERVMKNVRENVSGVDSYHTTADDLLAAGRAKAAPLYDEAYEGVVSTVKPFAKGVSLSAGKQYKRGDEWLQSIDIMKDGKKSGSIGYVTEGVGTQNPSFTIKRVDVDKGGQGIGTEAYRQLIDENLAQGFIIKSDADVSKPAQRMYEKLKDAGYNVVESDKAKTGFEYKKTTVSGDERKAQNALWPTELKDGVRTVKEGYANLVGDPVYTISSKAENLPKEIQTAIAKARRQFPSELEGLEDNAVKVLDYAKRVLDDDINTASRAGKGNLAGSRVKVKNELLDMIDSQVPAYKKAREVSGDYLSINNAMEQGRKALKTDSELLAKEFKKLSDPEKQAYQIGLGKAIRDEVGKVAEGANPYRRILSSPEKQKRISSVLSPVQYNKLEAGLKAEDRLFKMRKEILGGSPTAGKQEAKSLISNEEAAAMVLEAPMGVMKKVLRKWNTGLNDKTAAKVSEILYETDPIKKLEILNKLKLSKDFTPQEARIIKKTYFDAADQFDIMRTMGAVGGGALPAIIGEE